VCQKTALTAIAFFLPLIFIRLPPASRPHHNASPQHCAFVGHDTKTPQNAFLLRGFRDGSAAFMLTGVGLFIGWRRFLAIAVTSLASGIHN
jgi:hypothetical protein